MQIIISDGCYLKSLRDASLCGALTCLPYKVAIPDVVFEDRDTELCEVDKKCLLNGGIEILELPGNDVLKVSSLSREHPSLTVNSSFAFILARKNPESLLLTDDSYLLKIARTIPISTRSILWLLNEIHQLSLVSSFHLCEALHLLQKNFAFNLSPHEVRALEKKFYSNRNISH